MDIPENEFNKVVERALTEVHAERVSPESKEKPNADRIGHEHLGFDYWCRTERLPKSVPFR